MLARIVLTLIASVVVLAGCGGDGDEPSGEQRTHVVAAFYPLALAAEWIGGDSVDVVNLTPPGAEPHDIELSIRDVERVRDADIVLYLAGFQPALERATKNAKGRTLDLLQGLDVLAGGQAHEGEEGAEHEGESSVDPHVWLDPLRYAEIAERIGRALDAQSAAAEFTSELRALHEEYERGLADCDRRKLVTSHTAFAYLADRYGLEQISLTGVSPEAEPSARELEQLIEEVRSSGATTVFFETLVSPKLAETVAREAGATTAVLDPIEGLSEEDLRAGENYLSVMRRNLDTLRGALACR